MPIISVIVPVYKVEKYLHRCVDSILAQTFTDFELILVDDGSPDNCPAICDAYAMQDERIVTVHKSNGGVSSARNCGIHVARGEYLTFIDSDDEVKEEYLQKLYQCIQTEEADISICSFWKQNDDDTYSLNLLPERKLDFSDKSEQSIEYMNSLYRYGLLYGPWVKLYRTNIITDNAITFNEQMKFGEDTDFVFRYLSYSKNIAYAPYAGYVYYATPNSAVRDFKTRGEDYIKLYFYLYQMEVEFFEKKGYNDKKMYIQCSAVIFEILAIKIDEISKEEKYGYLEKKREIERLLKDPTVQKVMQYLPYIQHTEQFQKQWLMELTTSNVLRKKISALTFKKKVRFVFGVSRYEKMKVWLKHGRNG